jgi:hypothetical protein
MRTQAMEFSFSFGAIFYLSGTKSDFLSTFNAGTSYQIPFEISVAVTEAKHAERYISLDDQFMYFAHSMHKTHNFHRHCPLFIDRQTVMVVRIHSCCVVTEFTILALAVCAVASPIPYTQASVHLGISNNLKPVCNYEMHKMLTFH